MKWNKTFSLTFLVLLLTLSLNVTAVSFDAQPTLLEKFVDAVGLQPYLGTYVDSVHPIEKLQGGLATVDGKEKVEYSWANITADPAIAFSLPKVMNFTQTIKVCNNADDAGYLFLDYWFTQPLIESSLVQDDRGNFDHNVSVDDVECHETGKSPNNVTTCSVTGTHQETRTYYEEHKTVLQTENESWGKSYHSVVTKGQYFQPQECKSYIVNYRPVLVDKFQTKGEWNMDVWGSKDDDWTCITDDSCKFSYSLDPSFSTAFTYKRNVQINMTGAFPATNNATVYVNFSQNYVDFNHLSANGNDVLFANFDESAQLPCYKETFDNTTQANYSILISNFSNATNTSVWMYYGNYTVGFANQCPELNGPTGPYLIADDMNTTTINSTIWNDQVGTNWGVAAGSGAYNSTTSGADICQQGGADNAQQKCIILANTSGVLKQSQSYQVDLSSKLNCSTISASGWSAGWAVNESTHFVGKTNFSFQGQDDMATRQTYQNGTATGSNSGQNRTKYLVNTTWIKINNNNAVTIYSWLNSTSTFTNQFIWYNNTIPLNVSTAPNSYLNNSNKFFLYESDGSGGGACNDQSGLLWYGVRVRAFLNQTPVIYFGAEQGAGPQPPIALVVNNATWETTGVRDSGGLSNYTIFVQFDGNNYNNVTQVNFSINGITYRDNQITNVTNGTGNNQTKFNITIFTPLNAVNDSSMSFNWSFYQSANSSANSLVAYSVNNTQPVDWGWWVNNFSYVSPLLSALPNKVTVNFTKGVPNNQVGMNYNVTLEWNQTNATGTTKLLNNATGYEDWNTTFSVVQVIVPTTVQMGGWLNLSFNGSFVLRSSTSNASQVLVPAGSLIVDNSTWETTGVRDSGGISNYTIFVEYDGNSYNNVSQVNFSINGITYRDSQITNVTNGTGNNQTKFNISVFTPLNKVNGSNMNFNWSFLQNSNSSPSNLVAYSSNQTQPVSWGWLVNNATYLSPLVGGHPNAITVNFSKIVSNNQVGMNYNVTLEWNQTNATGTTKLLTNSTTYEEWNTTFATVAVTATTTVQLKGWLNISFNGSFVNRDPNFTQVLISPSVNVTTFWTSPVNETNLTTFTANVTWSGNDFNYVLANFTYDAVTSNNTYISVTNSSGSNGDNINWTMFNMTLRPNLTFYNNTNYKFQWNFSAHSNVTNISSNTSPQNQAILWSYWLNNATWQSPVTEGAVNIFEVNMTKQVDLLGPAFIHNTTIQYNGVNGTLGTLSSNNTAWETWDISETAPLPGTYAWVAWLNLSFQGVFLNRSNYSSTNKLSSNQVVTADGQETNQTFTITAQETGLSNFTLNVTNHTAIKQMNFTFQNQVWNPTNLTSFSNYSTANYTDFNISVRSNLVDVNGSNYSFRWNWTMSTGSNVSSTNYSQSLLFAYYLTNVSWQSPVSEGTQNNFTITRRSEVCEGGLPIIPGGSQKATIEYNGTNQSQVGLNVFVGCGNTVSFNNMNMTSPQVNSDTYVQFKPWANFTYNGITKARTLANQTQLVANLSFNVTYSGYVNNGSYDFVRNLTSVISVTCLGNSTLERSINGVINAAYPFNCSVGGDNITNNYVHSVEGNYTISWVILFTGGTNSTSPTANFISDLLNPVVDYLNITSNLSFFNVSSAYNVTMRCTDTEYNPLNYTLQLNSALLFNGSKQNNSNQTNQTLLSSGVNIASATCADPFGSTTAIFNTTLYLKSLALIDEVNNIACDVSNITSVRVYLDDNSTFFDYKNVNVSTINVSIINNTNLNNSRLRFELIYSNGAVITRYIDVSLLSESSVRVCCNKDGLTYFEQIITSAVTRPITLKSIFANCYVAADYTRFAFEDRKALKAFTIQRPYYLSTVSGTTQVLLSSVDGSIQTEINLDTLELIAHVYDFGVIQSALTFQHSGSTFVTIAYNNTANDNVNGTLVITDTTNNNVLFNTSSFTDPNSWILVFNYNTANLTNSTVFQLTYTAKTTSGLVKTTKTYFTGRGTSGFIINEVAALVAIIFLLFGLSLTSARTTFAWFGLVICLATFLILTLAVGGVWYITFLQAITGIVAVYIAINLVKQNGDIVT